MKRNPVVFPQRGQMLPEESDVVRQIPVVSLLLCCSHIPTFILLHHGTGRVPRALLASACLLLITAHGRTGQVTIFSHLALPIRRLASSACLQHGATVTMLDLYTSSVQHSPRSAPVLRLWS